MLIKSITETCGDVIECCEESQMQFLIDNSSNQKLPHNWKHLLKRPSAGIALVIMGQDWCVLWGILDKSDFVPASNYPQFSCENIPPINQSITSICNLSCFYLPCYRIQSMRPFSIWRGFIRKTERHILARPAATGKGTMVLNRKRVDLN